MTRLPVTQPVQVRPQNDMLTALLGAAVLAQIIALIVLFVRANTVFGGLFNAP
jgi:hypothetical protein